MFLVGVLTAHMQSVPRDQRETSIGVQGTSEEANGVPDWKGPQDAVSAPEIGSRAPAEAAAGPTRDIAAAGRGQTRHRTQASDRHHQDARLSGRE